MGKIGILERERKIQKIIITLQESLRNPQRRIPVNHQKAGMCSQEIHQRTPGTPTLK